MAVLVVAEIGDKDMPQGLKEVNKGIKKVEKGVLKATEEGTKKISKITDPILKKKLSPTPTP